MANLEQNQVGKENSKTFLASLKTILEEKRQMNKELETDIERLTARKAFLMHRKMETAVRAAEQSQSSFNAYFHSIGDQLQQIIQSVRAQNGKKDEVLGKYLEQYNAIESELKTRVENKQSFDEYTYMSHDQLREVQNSELDAIKKLAEAIKSEQLNLKGINTAYVAKFKELSDEIELFNEYLDELKVLKR